MSYSVNSGLSGLRLYLQSDRDKTLHHWQNILHVTIDSPTGNFLTGETENFLNFTFLGHPTVQCGLFVDVNALI